MTFGEVFAVINELVAGFNQLRDAVGSSLTGGVLDYNKLGNKPSINSVELVGDRAQSELALEADAATLQAVRDLGAQIDGFTVERQGYVLRLSVVETNRTADVSRIASLEGEKTARDQDLIAYKATMNALAASVSERMGNVESRETSRNEKMSREVTSMRADVATVQQGLVQKADKSSTPDAATWVSLRAAMEADLARAEEAAAGVSQNEDFLAVVGRLKLVINRLNQSVNFMSFDKTGTSCGTSGKIDPKTCIPEISNNFDFEK